MKRKLAQKVLLGITAASLLMSGCGNKQTGTDPAPTPVSEVEENETETSVHEEEKPNSVVEEEPTVINVNVVTPSESRVEQYADMSIELLKRESSASENVMISPASIMFALDMCAEGASGDTYEQMANIIAPGVERDDLKQDAAYFVSLFEDDTMHIANSVWANESIVGKDGINSNYMSTLKNYYSAEAFSEEFTGETVNKINGWIDDNTNHMIPQVIDDTAISSSMILVNCLAFDGSWEEAYEEGRVNENGTFNGINGEEEATMMSSTEGIYLENSSATGFIKPYEGDKFSFMAILPKDEDVNIADFVGNFTGADYMELYNSAQYTDVQTIMPKISFEYENDLNKTLIDLGMTDAFDSELAQFDDMVADPDAHQFYVGRVIHKTKIDINEDGTQAAAATVVMMKEMAAAPAPVLYVNLDRPYAFAIIDNETGAPVFMGTVNTTK